MVSMLSSSPKKLFQASIAQLVDVLDGVATMRAPNASDVRDEEGKVVGKEYSPQAVELFVLQVRDNLREAKELAQQIGEETKDLHSAKNPEVERLAAQIFAAGPAHMSAETAFQRAEAFMAFKNQRRQA